MIAYYVVACPKTRVRRHGVTHDTKDDFNANEASYAAFDVVNTGTEATGADIYQTWLD